MEQFLQTFEQHLKASTSHKINASLQPVQSTTLKLSNQRPLHISIESPQVQRQQTITIGFNLAVIDNPVLT